MASREKRFFNIAKEISYFSNFKRTRIGAVVTCGSKVISTGYNSTKSSIIQHRYNKKRFDNTIPYIPMVHAEIDALTPLMNNHQINWNKIELYIYREHKDGTVSCSRPCESCLALIEDLGIKKIHYTDWNGSFKEEKLRGKNVIRNNY